MKTVDTIDITEMLESKDYSTCPYCQTPEPENIDYNEAIEKLR